MNEPSEEQIKKFWEKIADEVEVFSGGKHYHFRFGDKWYDGDQIGFATGIPTIGLNNLFKYAVPKLQRDGFGYVLSDSQSKLPHIATFYTGYREGAEDIAESAYDDDPALALFLAINKVMEAE